MGDRLRKYTKQLGKLAFQAGLPGLLIYGILIGSFVLRGTPHNDTLMPLMYLRLLLACYLTAFLVTCVLHYKEMIHAVLRSDEQLIGKNFGGFRRQDKLFCSGMEAYAADRPREALEYFLAVQDEFELSVSETGVLAFYLGRCYQMLDCPSNAVTYYRKARENGFSEPFAKLFEARSCSECGDFSNSLTLFQDLLEHDPPKEFYFLYTDIGYLYIKQKQPEQAEEWFRKSIDQKQNYAFALGGMAIASLQKGDFAAAQDYHYKALVNRLDNAVSFRKYYEETKRLMLDAHPEWSEKTGAHPEPKKAAESES
ncbi:MAG: tetratricopeptide repeat protein [Oscillospiraceae bacterium]|nr:tetratricopeptide repeat protein [Oscillospiraceae bacterium]